jgi:Trk K+ transport system NAD-binding subunit
MGIRTADGSHAMNPPMDTRIQSGDEIFAIAEDDDKIQLANLPALPARRKPDSAFWNRIQAQA